MMRLFKTSTTLFLFLLTLACQSPEQANLADGEFNKPAEATASNAHAQLVLPHPYSFGFEPEKPAAIADYVRRIFEDSNKNLWLATNSLGVSRYDGDSLVYFSTKDGLSGNQVTGIIEDQRGHIWFSTNGGVSMYDGEHFTNYTTEHGLSSNSVWSIFEDSSGTIWAGTIDGLCKIDPSAEIGFTKFVLPKANVTSPTPRFSTSLISSIMEDKDGYLWFGTDGVGVCKYDPSASEGKQFTHFTKNDGLCGNNIVSILQDKSGKLWFSSRFGGLSQFDGNTFTNFSEASGAIGNNEVWTMFEDKKGNIWFSSEGFGIYRHDGEGFTNFGEAEGLPIRAVQAIFEDKKGSFWIGGGGGLYLFNGRDFTHVTRKGPWGLC